MLPKTQSFIRPGHLQSNSKSSKFAFRHSFAQSTHWILREGSSSKIKTCVSLQRRAIQNFKMNVSLLLRAQKGMNPARDVRGNPRQTKITILPQWREGCAELKICVSSQFWTSGARNDERVASAITKNLHFTTVLDARRARSEETVASAI